MEERRTINAPLRLSTAFMCVSLAAVRFHLRVSGHVSNVAPAIDASTSAHFLAPNLNRRKYGNSKCLEFSKLIKMYNIPLFPLLFRNFERNFRMKERRIRKKKEKEEYVFA